jgi:hypothetical protein
MSALQPHLWEEIRLMASTSDDRIHLEWDKIAKFTDLREALNYVPAEEAVQVFGVDKLIEAIGDKQAIQAIGNDRAIQAIVNDQEIQTTEVEKLLGDLFTRIPEERRQEVLRALGKKE